MSDNPYYTPDLLRQFLRQHPELRELKAMTKLSVYKNSRMQPWFPEVLSEFGVQYQYRPQPPRWTPERVREAVATHKWATRAEMKKTKVGAAILMACYGNPDMLAELPVARFKAPNSNKNRPPVPKNCWPFGNVRPKKAKPEAAPCL